MMVAIVPNLIDAPELTTAAIILWVTLCLFVALHDRTPRSYMFVLSGYTAALIGFPSVLAPGTVFDTAVSRVEEITIGVVCAALVHSLIFPQERIVGLRSQADICARRRAPVDRRRTDQDGDAGGGNGATPHRRRHHRALCHRHQPALRHLAEFIPISAASAPSTARSWRCCRCSPPSRIGSTCCAAWGRYRTRSRASCRTFTIGCSRRRRAIRARADELRQACLAATPAVGERNSWADLVAANLTERLAELINSWQASLDLAAYLADPSRQPSAEIRALGAQLGEKPLHTDWGIALLSALSATVAMGICTFFWIVTAWPEGANAVAIAAVACTLFATLDDPTPTLRALTILLALCIPIVLVYQFFLLPAITGFELLSLSLAFVLIPAGILMTIPRYAIAGLALALGFTVEMSLQTNYTADFAQIVNSQQRLCRRRADWSDHDAADACHRRANGGPPPVTRELSRSRRPCRRQRADDAR